MSNQEHNEIKLLSSKFKVQAAVLKVSRLLKNISDEKFQEVINESMIYRPVNVVQKLDLFKSAMGEHYEDLCDNPAFNRLLYDWELEQNLENLRRLSQNLSAVTSEPISMEDIVYYYWGLSSV
jgi:ribosome-interacting GTPase 1